MMRSLSREERKKALERAKRGVDALWREREREGGGGVELELENFILQERE